MATLAAARYDEVVRKVLFGLELVDLLSGIPVTRGLELTADGLGVPRRLSSSGFVWLLNGEPEARTVVVRIVSTDLRFRDRNATITVPANDGLAKPHLFRRKRLLWPTGLTLPPPGMTAVAGMLIDDNVPAGPVADAMIRIELPDLGGGVLVGSYRALSDRRGGFVAAAPNFREAVPTSAPPPAPEGSVVGWLRIRSGGVTRYTPKLAMRPGRVLRLAEPLQLSTLSLAPPSP